MYDSTSGRRAAKANTALVTSGGRAAVAIPGGSSGRSFEMNRSCSSLPAASPAADCAAAVPGAGCGSRDAFPEHVAANVLAGQTALVTGGGTGLGLAIARALGKLGARVVIASRKREHLDPGANAIRGDGTAVLPVQVDIREPEQVDAMVAQAIDAFGHIDILVNNAA